MRVSAEGTSVAEHHRVGVEALDEVDVGSHAAGPLEGRLGLLLQPGNGYRNQIENYEFWAADNGCFTTKAG